MSEQYPAAGVPNKKLTERNEWVEIKPYEGDPGTMPEYWGIPTRVQMRLQKGGIALDLYVPGYGSYQFIEVPALDETPLIERRAVLDALTALREECSGHDYGPAEVGNDTDWRKGLRFAIHKIDARIAALTVEVQG